MLEASVIIAGVGYESWCISNLLDEAQAIHDRNLDKVAHYYAVCRLVRKCKLPPDTAYYWATWRENHTASPDPLDNMAHLYGSDCASSERCPGMPESCYSCCQRTAGQWLPNY